MELAQAEWIDSMCRRYHCLPSQLLAEDSQLLQILELVTPTEGGEVPNDIE